MQFNTKEIVVDASCKEFTVHLKHVGKMAKAAMGHNWVLTKAADMQPVATDGMTAGLANNYVKADDARVIAHTQLTAGGESDSEIGRASCRERGGQSVSISVGAVSVKQKTNNCKVK